MAEDKLPWISGHGQNDMMRPCHLVAAGAAGLTSVLMPQAAPVAPIAGTTALRAGSPGLAADSASVRFSLQKPGQVEIDLYDVAGQRMNRFVSG